MILLALFRIFMTLAVLCSAVFSFLAWQDARAALDKASEAASLAQHAATYGEVTINYIDRLRCR